MQEVAPGKNLHLSNFRRLSAYNVVLECIGLVKRKLHQFCAVGGSGTLTNENLNSCGPILCKIQPALVQACASYNDGASLGPGSITVSAEIGTDVALQWTNSTKTATFAFRGTSSSEVYLRFLKLSLWFETVYKEKRNLCWVLVIFIIHTDYWKWAGPSFSIVLFKGQR